MSSKKSAQRAVKIATTEDPTPSRDLLTKKQRRTNLVVFAISAFFTGSANLIQYTFYNPFFLEIRPDSQRLIGIVATIASFCSILGLILSDFLNTKIGYKNVTIIGFILIAVSFIVFVLRPSIIIWVILSALILNFSFTLYESPYYIMLTETAGEKQKGRISSLIAFFGRSGEVLISALIPVIINSFVVFSNIQRSYFYIYSASVFLIITIVILFLLTDPASVVKKLEIEQQLKEQEIIELEISEEKSEIIETHTEPKPRSFLGGFIDTFKDKWVLRVALTFFFDGLIWSTAFGVHIAGLLDEDLLATNKLVDADLSILFLVTNIVVLVVMFPAGWLVDKLGAKTLLYISESCGFLWGVAIIFFIFFPWNFWILILSRVALGLSIALWIPSTISLYTNVNSKVKSKVYNSIAIFRTLGFLPGGLIAGFLYDSIPQPYGFLTPIFILLGCLLILIPLFITLPNRPPGNGEINGEKTLPK